MMPSQKDGVAMPPMASVRTTTSIQVFCFSAEMVPSGIGDQDGDHRGEQRDLQRDRQPREDLQRHRLAGPHRDAEVEVAEAPDEARGTARSAAGRGRARRGSCVSARGSKLPPPEPRRTTQMSPGISRIRMNTSAAAPISVGITSSTRLAMYWYIPSSRSLFVVQAPRVPFLDGTRNTRVRSTVRRLVQPDIRQVLVDIVARTDLPACDVGPLGHHRDTTRASGTPAPRYRRCASRIARINARCLVKSVSRSILL